MRLNELFEKLLPPLFWKGRRPQKSEVFWQGMAAPMNTQSQAILDTAQEKFGAHISEACDLKADDRLRLRALDRAVAISELLESIARDMAAAPEQIKEMERQARLEVQGAGPQREN